MKAMKKEIVYTDKYALILSDEEIKEGDWVFGGLGGVDIKQYGKYFAEDWIKIIAHLPLSDAPMLEGVPLLPPLPQGEDVEGLAKDTTKKYINEREKQTAFLEFIEGYNKAKEKYKYTQEDMINFAIWKSITVFNTPYTPLGEFRLWESLQQPLRPTHFECEMVRTPSQIFYTYDVPYHSPKTTTNSQGQVELVGKYI